MTSGDDKLEAQARATQTGLHAMAKVSEALAIPSTPAEHLRAIGARIEAAEREAEAESFYMEPVATDLMNAVFAFDNQVHSEHEPDLHDEAWMLHTVREARRMLADTERSLENRCGSLMKSKRETIEGLGTLERHPNKSYTKWDREALKRDVLDSRIADENGEVVDETPLDKILDVWNLGAPRRTALNHRGLTPDEYCEVEDNGGFKVQVIS